MNDREAREVGTASVEARRSVPTAARKPAEECRQNMMVRYLQAMSSHDVPSPRIDIALEPQEP